MIIHKQSCFCVGWFSIQWSIFIRAWMVIPNWRKHAFLRWVEPPPETLGAMLPSSKYRQNDIWYGNPVGNGDHVPTWNGCSYLFCGQISERWGGYMKNGEASKIWCFWTLPAPHALAWSLRKIDLKLAPHGYPKFPYHHMFRRRKGNFNPVCGQPTFSYTYTSYCWLMLVIYLIISNLPPAVSAWHGCWVFPWA